MTEIDANYIARTHGTDALRRTIDSNTSTRAMPDREQYADTTNEFSAGVATNLALIEDEVIEIHAAAEDQKPLFDENAPSAAEGDSGPAVTAPSSQSAEMEADKANSGQQQDDHQENQQNQRQKTKSGNGTPPPPVPPSVQWPDLDKRGNPKRTYRNARAAMEALGIICSYDEFHDRMFVAGHSVGEWAGELSDALGYVLRQAIIDNFELDPGKNNVSDATTELCLERRFNPILDYLNGLKWDIAVSASKDGNCAWSTADGTTRRSSSERLRPDPAWRPQSDRLARALRVTSREGGSLSPHRYASREVLLGPVDEA
jgi:hypothetical protein